MVATDADFGARQTLYAAGRDLPGDTFVGPRFGSTGPSGPTVRSPGQDQGPAASENCPSWLTRHRVRVLTVAGDFGLTAPLGYPERASRRGWYGHRYRRRLPHADSALAVPEIPRPTKELSWQPPVNNLSVKVRTETGRAPRAAPAARGQVPAVLYGHGTDPQHLLLPAHDLAAVLRHSGTNAVLVLDIGHRAAGLTKALGDPPDPAQHPARRPAGGSPRRKVTVEVNVTVEGDAAPGTLVTQDANTIEIEAGRCPSPKHVTVSVGDVEAGTQIWPARSPCRRASPWCPTPNCWWSTSWSPRPPRNSTPGRRCPGAPASPETPRRRAAEPRR